MPKKAYDNIDPRLLAANENVAAIELKGTVKTRKYVKGELFQGKLPVSGVFKQPNGALTCQLLFGNEFRVLEKVDEWCFGQVVDDGYIGYVLEENLVPSSARSHQVSVLGTGLYQKDEIKSGCLNWLPMGSKLLVKGVEGQFAKVTGDYFIPANHLQKIGQCTEDFVSVAEKFIHAPYLWGGNSPLGIDCSGLVSIALGMTGTQCPRDSDQQYANLGALLEEGDNPRRGDLAFWEGHVGVMVDHQDLLHATAFHMLVVVEPLDKVLTRIETTESNSFLGLKRLTQPV